MYNAKVLSIVALAGVALAQTPGSDPGYPSDNPAGNPPDSTPAPAPTPAPTDGGNGGNGNSNAECTQSYVSIIAAAPTPDAALGSAINSYASSLMGGNGDMSMSMSMSDMPTMPGNGNGNNPFAAVTQVCAFASQLPQTLQGDFSAYATSVVSFVSAQSSNLDAVITNCLATGTASTDAAAYTSFVNSVASQSGPLCGAAATDTATATDTTTVMPTTTDNGTGGVGGPTSETAYPSTSSLPAPTNAAAPGAALPTGLLANAAAAAGLLGAVALF